jgi:arylsulfatase A-like enzyme
MDNTDTAIILITCDELKKDTLSCYGNRAITTGNIDRLKEMGTDFDRAYTASPWCLPARCSILTGLYPHNSGAYSNFRPCPLDKGRKNLFRELKNSGYTTAVFGKCHFIPVEYGKASAEKTLPYDKEIEYYKSLGIDHLELEDGKQVSVWFQDDYSRELERAGYLQAYREAVWSRENQKVFPFPGPTNLHPDYWVGERAAEHIRSSKEDALFAWISFSGPHYPFDAPQEYWEKVDEEKLPPIILEKGEFDGEDRIHHDSYHGGRNSNIDGSGPAPGRACKNYTEDYWRELRISYHANMKLIDDQIGKIIDAVHDRNGDNALILFTADHGEMLGNHGLWGKHNCGYEEVWKIPMIVKFPGQKKGESSKKLVNSTDIFPTCLEAAGAEEIECDGISLYRKEEREYTFAEGEGYLAITDGRYKYIHVQKGQEAGRELLDLQEEPQEFRNLMGLDRYQPVLARLREKMIEHMLPAILP